MNGILNSHDAAEDEDDEWVFVGTTYTNTTPGSVHVIDLDLTPICENMSNKAFGKLIDVIRWDEQKQRNITCTVFPDNGIADAAVCKPDSDKRIIAIYPHFCTLPDARLSSNCKLKVLIHECTHYVDTFDSNDEIYGFGTGLKYWARDHRDLAINNADSLACYISFFDDRVLW
ncbi:M35 family metallo-endopeptidase [Burkholderia sp. GbtcB21]|uniref:M35 family metallo-endopeptidase n=1 Tax=Burkholderia sp. GbtcB21 TaxID=2824766 RepID=UPI001C2F428A|nr:M35 family metallo-endopeptidase [Burkholderia sp. GbtcB21]